MGSGGLGDVGKTFKVYSQVPKLGRSVKIWSGGKCLDHSRLPLVWETHMPMSIDVWEEEKQAFDMAHVRLEMFGP